MISVTIAWLLFSGCSDHVAQIRTLAQRIDSLGTASLRQGLPVVIGTDSQAVLSQEAIWKAFQGCSSIEGILAAKVLQKWYWPVEETSEQEMEWMMELFESREVVEDTVAFCLWGDRVLEYVDHTSKNCARERFPNFDACFVRPDSIHRKYVKTCASWDGASRSAEFLERRKRGLRSIAKSKKQNH